MYSRAHTTLTKSNWTLKLCAHDTHTHTHTNSTLKKKWTKEKSLKAHTWCVCVCTHERATGVRASVIRALLIVFRFGSPFPRSWAAGWLAGPGRMNTRFARQAVPKTINTHVPTRALSLQALRVAASYLSAPHFCALLRERYCARAQQQRSALVGAYYDSSAAAAAAIKSLSTQTAHSRMLNM